MSWSVYKNKSSVISISSSTGRDWHRWCWCPGVALLPIYCWFCDRDDVDLLFWFVPDINFPWDNIVFKNWPCQSPHRTAARTAHRTSVAPSCPPWHRACRHDATVLIDCLIEWYMSNVLRTRLNWPRMTEYFIMRSFDVVDESDGDALTSINHGFSLSSIITSKP